MTVIAWDCKTLAADGRTTMGSTIITDKKNKLIQFNHRELGQVVAGFCGAVIVVNPWIKHMGEHGFAEFELPESEFPGEYDTSCLAVARDGECYELEASGLWNRVQHPLAYGSGCVIANHFLKEGYNSLDAVRETIKSDSTCGGQIMVYDWKKNKISGYS